ncbi:MAG TPA: hypothetical protein VIH21_04645 [Dehalococcoidia bacterium]
MFDASLAAHAARDIPRSIDLAQQAIAGDPRHVAALEHLASLLITRRRAFAEGLPLIERAVALRPEDAGLWYSLGWDYEFAAHELRRRPTTGNALNIRGLYERAAEGFRQCLALSPAGKLQGDAEDLLDHVDNELRSL